MHVGQLLTAVSRHFFARYCSNAIFGLAKKRTRGRGTLVPLMRTSIDKILIILLVLFGFTCLHGQQADSSKCIVFHDVSINRDYYKATETPPTYKESSELMFAYLRNNIVLPSNCEPGCHKLFAELIVEKDGKLTFIKFMSSQAPEELKDAFKKVISGMANWTPGTCDKKNVASYIVIPFYITVR